MGLKILNETEAGKISELHPSYPAQTANIGKRATVIPRGDFRTEYSATVIRDDKERRENTEGELVTLFLLEDGRCLTNKDVYFYAFGD